MNLGGDALDLDGHGIKAREELRQLLVHILHLLQHKIGLRRGNGWLGRRRRVSS
jgi:hypothetical protein